MVAPDRRFAGRPARALSQLSVPRSPRPSSVAAPGQIIELCANDISEIWLGLMLRSIVLRIIESYDINI